MEQQEYSKEKIDWQNIEYQVSKNVLNFLGPQGPQIRLWVKLVS